MINVNDLFDLSGRVALVTGGTHGIGMACGKALAAAGAKLCVNDIDDAKLAEAKEEYAKDGIDVYTLNFNVTSEAEVDKGITQIEQEVGPVDILVNNAGIIKRVPIMDMPLDDFKTVIDVDLVAPLIVAKRVAKGMIERRQGKIINMCSMMSVYGRQNVSAYASAKGGLKLLTAEHVLRMGQIQFAGKWHRTRLYCHITNCTNSCGGPSFQRSGDDTYTCQPMGRARRCG